MGWKITRDYENERHGDSEASRAGLTVGVLNGDTVRFRIRDDDDIVYYAGEADSEALERDDHPRGLYGALRWAMADAGATDLQLKVSDAVRLGMTSQRYVEQDGLAEDAWVSIYG